MERRNFNVFFDSPDFRFKRFARGERYGYFNKTAALQGVFRSVINRRSASFRYANENFSRYLYVGSVDEFDRGFFVGKFRRYLNIARGEIFAETYAGILPFFGYSREYLYNFLALSVEHHSGNRHKVSAVSACFGRAFIILAVGGVFTEICVVVKAYGVQYVFCDILGKFRLSRSRGDESRPATVEKVIETAFITYCGERHFVKVVIVNIIPGEYHREYSGETVNAVGKAHGRGYEISAYAYVMPGVIVSGRPHFIEHGFPPFEFGYFLCREESRLFFVNFA